MLQRAKDVRLSVQDKSARSPGRRFIYFRPRLGKWVISLQRMLPMCYKRIMRDWVREKLMRRRKKPVTNNSESTGKIGHEIPQDQPTPLQPSYPQSPGRRGCGEEFPLEQSASDAAPVAEAPADASSRRLRAKSARAGTGEIGTEIAPKANRRKSRASRSREPPVKDSALAAAESES